MKSKRIRTGSSLARGATCKAGASTPYDPSISKYDIVEAGRAEYAKLTPEQKRDPMEGVMAAVRGIFAVSEKMFNDAGDKS